MKKALLALEDGTVFHGRSAGADGERNGEVIFNTAMTGYQEILTDPSYRGQIVAMTYPLIGNYGVNRVDRESPKVQAEGFAVRNISPIASNWRKEESLSDWLKSQGTVAIEGIDTRRLTLLLREKGVLKGVLSTVDLDGRRLVKKAQDSPGLVGRDLVKEVTPREIRQWRPDPLPPQRGQPPLPPKGGRPLHVVAVDCGMKANIPRRLTKAGCRVTVAPASVTAQEIFGLKPDGLFLSNGPGDPEALSYLVGTVRACLGKVPIFGICLGHQVLGLALGGKTFKLKFGHHGANHPVLDLATRRVEITSQNHGFSVDPASVPGSEAEMTHLNLNDKTCEGIRHRKLPVFSVQYHPEAAPGPHDAGHLFERFARLMREGEIR